MRLVLLVAAAALVLPSSATPTSIAPVNDLFVDAIDLNPAGEFGFVQGSNVNAGKEPLEPDHAQNEGGRSVWYTWTAPLDGSVPHVAVRVFGEFDTVLGVYTGTTVDALAEVASNDDAGGLSSVSFSTSAGATYRIAVDGFAGKSGSFTIHWRKSPANDNFADAIVLTGASGGRSGDTTRGATQEHGETSFGEGGETVWYSWTPPADGTYKIATAGSRFDTVLAVFEGSSLETLELIGVNDDDPDRGCCTSWIPLRNATATTTYRIQVTPLSFDAGQFALQWGPLILGTNGADALAGTGGAEEIRGRGGTDTIAGGGGGDLVFGGGGNDILAGGAGNDLLFDRAGIDVLRGQQGNDTLDARDRAAGDTLRGGTGNDVCRANRGDRKRGCS
jgi:Ca2+-binding RTX toxin-like protein